MGRLIKTISLALIDMWGIIALALLFKIALAVSDVRLPIVELLKLNFSEFISAWYKAIGFNPRDLHLIILSEYCLLSISCMLSLFITLGMYITSPLLTQISCLLIVLRFLPDIIEDFCSKIVSYAVLAPVTLLLAVRLVNRRSHNKNDLSIGGMFTTKNRFNFEFFYHVVSAVISILISLLKVKLLSFETKMQMFLYILVVFLEIQEARYTFRCLNTLYFCKTCLRKFRKISSLEKISLFFLARSAAVAKLFNIVFGALFKMLSYFKFAQSSNTLKILDENHAKVFYSVIFNTSYLHGSRMSRRYHEDSAFRNKIEMLYYIEEFLPMIALTGVLFVLMFSPVLYFFNAREIFLIVVLNFVTYLEMLRSFVVVNFIVDTPIAGSPDDVSGIIVTEIKKGKCIDTVQKVGQRNPVVLEEIE